MTKSKSPWWPHILLPVGIVLVFGPLFITGYVKERREREKQIKAVEQNNRRLQFYVDVTTYDLNKMMAAWREGDNYETQKASIAVWSDLENIARLALDTPSISAETETKLVALLESENSKRYFSSKSVRAYFAEDEAIAQLRDMTPNAPPHLQRLWKTVEARLSEPPIPMPAVTRKR